MHHTQCMYMCIASCMCGMSVAAWRWLPLILPDDPSVNIRAARWCVEDLRVPCTDSFGASRSHLNQEL